LARSASVMLLRAGPVRLHELRVLDEDTGVIYTPSHAPEVAVPLPSAVDAAASAAAAASASTRTQSDAARASFTPPRGLRAIRSNKSLLDLCEDLR
jgi:hypothetical protein